MANYNVPAQNRLRSVIIGLVNLRVKYVAKHYYIIHFKDNVFPFKNVQHYDHRNCTRFNRTSLKNILKVYLDGLVSYPRTVGNINIVLPSFIDKLNTNC